MNATMTAQNIPDGRYLVIPDGGDGTVYRFRSGRMVAYCEQSMRETFEASNDSRARLWENEDLVGDAHLLGTAQHAALVRWLSGFKGREVDPQHVNTYIMPDA